MAEYIEREAVLTLIQKLFDTTQVDGEEQIGVLKCHRIVREHPTADVAEVKWIPVTERLPKGRRDYLCICVLGESKMQFCNVLMFHPEQNAENGYVTGPHFSNEGVEGMRVTHWMPLPELPEVPDPSDQCKMQNAECKIEDGGE